MQYCRQDSHCSSDEAADSQEASKHQKQECPTLTSGSVSDCIAEEIDSIDPYCDTDEECTQRPQHACARWISLMVSCFVMFGWFYPSYLPAATREQLRDHMPHDNFEFLFNMLFALSYVPGIVIPPFAGLSIDKFGAAASLTGFFSLHATGVLVMTLGVVRQSWKVLLVGRLVSGLGRDAAFVANQTLVATLFVGKEIGLAFGLNSTVAYMGMVAGNILSPIIANVFGIEMAYWVGTSVSGVALIMTVILYLMNSNPLTRHQKRYSRIHSITGLMNSKGGLDVMTVSNSMTEVESVTTCETSNVEDTIEKCSSLFSEAELVTECDSPTLSIANLRKMKLRHFRPKPRNGIDPIDRNSFTQEIASPAAPLGAADGKRFEFQWDIEKQGERAADKGKKKDGRGSSPFRRTFWFLCVSTMMGYAIPMSFMHITTGFLMERDFFKPREDMIGVESTCKLKFSDQCTDGYLAPPEGNPLGEGTTICSSDEGSRGYAPPIPTSVNFADPPEGRTWLLDEYKFHELQASHINCADPFFSEGCTAHYCQRRDEATERASIFISIPAFSTIALSAILGYLSDRTGWRIHLIFLSPVLYIACYAMLTFTSIHPAVPIILQGVGYAVCDAVHWPSVAFTIDDEGALGKAYGIMTSIACIGTAALPFMVALVHKTAHNGGRYLPWVGTFFLVCSEVMFMSVTLLFDADRRTGERLGTVTSKEEPEEPDTALKKCRRPSQERGSWISRRYSV